MSEVEKQLNVFEKRVKKIKIESAIRDKKDGNK